MILSDANLQPSHLAPAIERMWEVSAGKIIAIHLASRQAGGTPVFTVRGEYVSQGWTEWTQGFEFGSAILQFDATGESRFLELGRDGTFGRMASHVTHLGVHDHGFNNVSTYGGLWRLMREGRIPLDPREQDFYELALMASGAVQAARWSRTNEADGYIYSFNGPQSLFSDTIRSLRALALANLLGHRLMGENDQPICLLDRLLQHARTTARYNVYYGEGRDAYDVRGRVVHESIFNPKDGRYRCPSTQQGYSPFSTWTRGLAWIMLGFAEQLEFLQTLPEAQLSPYGGKAETEAVFIKAAQAASDYYLQSTPVDGIPYWDTGAPGLIYLDGHADRAADPFNDYEPVDSSAAAIAAQGLLRLARYLQLREQPGSPALPTSQDAGGRYWQAGLTVLRTLLNEPYLSTSPDHQGLLLHTIYHRPRGWDHVPPGSKIPRGEACMWGDYHLREVALYVQRICRGDPYYTFFGPSVT